MPSVDIEGIGTVEFDEGMSQEDISSAIEKDIIPRHQKGIDLRSQLTSVRSETGPMLNRAGLAVSEFPEKAMQFLDKPLPEPDLSYLPPLSERIRGPGGGPMGPYGEVTPEQERTLQESSDREKLADWITEKEHPIRTGLGRAAGNLAEGLTKPSSLVLGAATVVAPELTAPIWMTMGASQLRESAKQIQEAREEGDRAKYYEGVGNLAASLGQAIPGAKGTLNLARRVHGLSAIPEPSTAGGPDASRIESPAEVHGDVQPQTGPSVPEVSAEKSGAGVRDDLPQRAAEPETTKAPAQDVLGTLKPEAAKWEQQAKEALTGGLTQKAYDAGLAIENEADLAANREALAKLTKDRNEALERGDVDTGMRAGMQEQFLNEAHQAATGTKSGGQRQFELDPEYKPKFPQGEETLKAWRDAMEERKKQGQQVPASEPDFGKPEETKPTEGKAPPVEELPSLKVGNKTKRVFQVKESFYNPDDEGTYKPGDKIYDTQLIRAGFKLPEAKVAEAAKVEPKAAPVSESGYSAKGVEDFVSKLKDQGSAEGPPLGTKARDAWVRTVQRAESGPVPVEQLEKGLIDANVTVDKQNNSVTIHTSGYDDLKVAHETVTVTLGEDGSIRMFATSGKVPQLLDYSVKKALELFRGKEEPSPQPQSLTGPAAAKVEAEVAKVARTEPVGPAGPGAKAAGEPPYRAIQQLTDQLNATAPAGAAERLKAGEKIAEQWSQGKSLVDRATARMRNITETLKATARGVREVTDLDRAVAELDATLQQSSGESTNAKKALQRQMPNEFDRSAAAMSIEPASSPEILKEALKILPERTSSKVRRMLERAANPTPEMRQYAESLKQFFGIREQDAMQADLFQDGIRDYYTHVWGKEENMPDSLRGAFNSGRVSTYFQFARQRKIPTILEGIMEGKTPILDPAEVVPFYNYAMDKAIAGRAFVKQMTELDEPDGRPMTIIAGEGKRIEAGERVDAAILIKPKLKPEEFGDYKAVKHPAMQGWKWASKTEDGTPIFLKGDLLVHPNSYERIARMMDRDRLAPGPKMRVALRVGGEVKGMKLGGLPSLFHPLHLATHALAHWTNVFKTEPIQWDAPATRFALEKGHLKLAPNPSEINVFAEGMAATGLAQKIPIIGRWNKAYAHLLFEELIPRWKLKTFENAYARAQWMKKNLGFYKGLSEEKITARIEAKEFKTPEEQALWVQKKMRGWKGITDEQIAARIGDSVNNAFGELNHLFLGKMGRDPRVQRGLSLALLAPDFGEARLRFVEKIFTRYGHEERLAALTLAATLYTAARVANYLSHGNAESDDLKNAFRVKVGKHWWTMRSVLGDVVHAFDEPGQFTYVRLSPLYSRTASDFLWGRDQRTGRKLTRMDKVENIAKQLVPIPLSGLTQEERTFMEGFLQSMGVSNIRDTPVMDVQKLATQWRQSKGLDAGSEFIPSEGPSYWKLRAALNLGRTDHAANILSDLRKTHSDAQIAQAMNTWARHPYTGSMQHEAQFLGTLTPPQHQLYQKARSEQMATLQDFYRLMAAHPGQRRSAQQPNRDLEILRSMAR